MFNYFKVIIPNYNNSKYLRRCLDSVKNQTFKNYKCVIVDDMSTDNSVDIIHEYVKKDKEHFILLQNDEKIFAGGGRNKALELNLNTKYNIFIDSDDWLIDNSYFQRAFNKLIEQNENIEVLVIPNVVTEKTINGILKSGAAPWKYIVSSKYDWIKFPGYKKNDDIIWFLKLFDSIDRNKVCFLDGNDVYFYNRQSENSLWNNPSLKYSYEAINYDCILRERLSKITYVHNDINERAKKYIKEECFLTFPKSVDKKIYMFLSGKISNNRKNILLKDKKLFPNIEIVTENNLKDFVNKDYPIHEAFKYLTVNHKSDYLRCYLMFTHGGGYSDIKPLYNEQNNWNECFDLINKNNNLDIIGILDTKSPITKDKDIIKDLLSNCMFICRPFSEFTTKWFNMVTKELDLALPKLKLYRKTHPIDLVYPLRDCHYPLRWEQIQGEIFHKLCLEQKKIKPSSISNILLGGWDKTNNYR